jgi:hypothetical protein
MDGGPPLEQGYFRGAPSSRPSWLPIGGLHRMPALVDYFQPGQTRGWGYGWPRNEKPFRPMRTPPLPSRFASVFPWACL